MPRGELTEARVSITADSSKLKRELAATHQVMRSWGSSISSIIMGAVSLGGIAMGIRSIVKEVDEELKAIARLDAVLTSTHMAAGLTVDQLQRMASGLQAVTTYGDEAIMSAQALLLTFTRIGGDVFPRALKAVLDISAALGQDLKSSAIQVGKALQDPAWGITALRRVGVNFTRVQQDMIKGWVQHGEVARAQQFILAELEREFGGMSEAMRGTLGGAFQALRNDVGDLIQAMVGLGDTGEAIHDLSVALSAGLQSVGEQIRGGAVAIGSMNDGFSTLWGILKGLISAAGGFWITLVGIYGIMKALVGVTIDFVQWLGHLGKFLYHLNRLSIWTFRSAIKGMQEAFAGMDKEVQDMAGRFNSVWNEINSAIDTVIRFGLSAQEALFKASQQTDVMKASMGEVRRELAQLDEGLVQTGKTARQSTRDIWDEIKLIFDAFYRSIQLHQEAIEALESHWEYVERGWSGLVGTISSSIASLIRDTKMKFRDLISSIIQNLAYAIVEAAFFAAIMTAILSALGIPTGPTPFRTMFLGRLGFPATGFGRQPLQRAGGQPVIELRPTYQLMVDSRIVAGAVMVETARRRRYGL